MAFDPDKYLEASAPFDPNAYLQADQTMPASANAFGETGGGAALGRPINRGQLNVQAQPRPLESAMAAFTKSMIDVPVGAAQLATGGNLGTSELAQKLGKQAEPYQKENPIAYGAGRIAGAVAPAMGAANVIGQIPSFAKIAPLAQNVGMGTALGAMTPEETGKTGAELYKEQAKQGLIGGTLGAALTPLQKLAGVLRGPEQTSQMAGAVEKARGAGYVIPPTQANESIVNRVLEGTAGKISTAQNASAKNQTVTHKLVAKAIGLPEEEVISPSILKDIRTQASEAYDALASLPVKPALLPSSVMNRAGTPEIDPKKMVYDMRLLRNNADGYFEAYKRSADPEQLTKANQAKSAALQIETTLEDYAKSLGKDELLPALRDARQLMAKTYTIEKALNPVSGTVDAKALARELKKGKPLTEELKTVAEFAAQFPKAAQTTEIMGSRPQISPVDVGVAGIASAITNPKALAALAIRPAARAAALSSPVQNRLVQGQITPEQANLAKILMLQSGIPATNYVLKGKDNE
jgi:hypothetical protein